MANVSIEDLRTMYQNSLVLIKNVPVFVDRIYNDKKVGGLNLNNQRNEIFDLTGHLDMKAPGRCLGFVNFDGYVAYLSRNPVRNGGRPSVGLANTNRQFFLVDGYRIVIKEAVKQLTAPEIADTIKGRYPDIKDAWERVKNEAEKVVAFDRQFAISCNGCVYYKTKVVGKAKAPKTVYDIKWSQGFEYLITLLDNNYEKSTSAAE